jgi:hypothetical protein
MAQVSICVWCTKNGRFNDVMLYSEFLVIRKQYKEISKTELGRDTIFVLESPTNGKQYKAICRTL